MLRLTGRLADGWLPSLGGHYLTPEDVPQRQAEIDDAARAAGRDPADIERASRQPSARLRAEAQQAPKRAV